MLASPESYKKENENKTLEQLVLERTKLFNAIVEYEKKHIIGNEPFNYDEIAKPSAKDIYNMDNSYLKEITDLIITKSKQKKFKDYMYKVANDATNEDLLDSLLYPEDNHFKFYKKNETDTIWWVNRTDKVGEHLFSFDKKKIYNLFKDYPYELSDEEKEIFDKENPYWADFFKDRQKPKKDIENNIPICPNCNEKLTFMMPNGKTLYCDNCKKYYVNNNGVAGEETGSPYTRTDVLY